MRDVKIGPFALPLLLLASNLIACSSEPGQVSQPLPPNDPDPSTSVGPGGGAAGTAGTCKVKAGGIQMSAAPGTTPAIAYGGQNMGVVWDTPDGAEVHVAIADPTTGKKLGETTIAKGAAFEDPTIVADPDGYLALWSAPGGVMSQQIDATGKAMGATIELATTGVAQSHSKAVRTGNEFLVGWEGTQSGELGETAGQGPATPTTLAGSPAFPAPVANGTSAGVFWSDGANLSFAPVASPFGLGTVKTVAASGTNKNATTLGEDFFVAWEDDSKGSGSEQIYLSSMAPNGPFAKPVIAPAQSGSANWPSIAQAGSNIGVTYYQLRDSTPAIYLSLFHPDLSTAGEDIMVSPPGQAARYPSSVWTGNALAVTYAENQGPVRLTLVACP